MTLFGFSPYLQELFSDNPLGQSIGLCAMIVTVGSFAFTNEKKFRIVMLIGQLIFITHFIMIGASMGAIGFGLAAARTFWSTFINKEKYVYWVFFAVYIVVGFLRTQSWYDVLPLIGGLTAMTGLFFGRGIVVRYFFIAAPLIILLYNIIVGSIGGIVNEILVILINLSTISRIVRNNRTEV